MKEGLVLEIKKNSAIVVTKEGEFLSIPSESSWYVGQEVQFSYKNNKENFSNKSSNKKNLFIQKGVWVALAACLMLLLMPLANITEASSYVTIDINPSIELELKGDKVINVKALNIDAEKIIYNMPKDYQDIYSVTSFIIDKAKEMGYLTPDEENYIMIGVCDNDTDFLINEYENFIEEKLTEQQLEAEVLVVSGTKEEKKLADNKDVSLGKYVLQQNKKLEGIDISDEDLLKDDVKEILDTEQENKNSNNSINSNKNNINVPNNNGDNGNKDNTNVPNNSGDNGNKDNTNVPNNNGDNGNKDNTSVPNNSGDNGNKDNTNVPNNSGDNGNKDNTNVPNNNGDNNKDNTNVPNNDKSIGKKN